MSARLLWICLSSTGIIGMYHPPTPPPHTYTHTSLPHTLLGLRSSCLYRKHFPDRATSQGLMLIFIFEKSEAQNKLCCTLRSPSAPHQLPLGAYLPESKINLRGELRLCHWRAALANTIRGHKPSSRPFLSSSRLPPSLHPFHLLAWKQAGQGLPWQDTACFLWAFFGGA